MIAVASIVLSVIALVFSIFVFAEGRRRYKRDVFLKINEVMISEDQNRGRQLLLSQPDEVSVESLPRPDRANISRAMAMYETLGMYLRRGYLIEDDVFEMWGDPAYRAWCKAQVFVKYREQQSPGIPAY